MQNVTLPAQPAAISAPATTTATVTRKPYTPEAAERIARAGANKMEAQGYTWMRIGESGNQFLVNKPATEDEAEKNYEVTLSNGGQDGANTELQSCSCPFCEYGFRQHTCKHCKYILNEVQAEAERDGIIADEFAQYNDFGRHCLAMGEF